MSEVMIAIASAMLAIAFVNLVITLIDKMRK